jgi:hypothetical protein
VLGPVIVEGERATPQWRWIEEFEQRRKMGFGRFLTWDRIEKVAAFSAIDLPRWAGAWIYGDPSSPRGERPAEHRSASYCRSSLRNASVSASKIRMRITIPARRSSMYRTRMTRRSSPGRYRIMEPAGAAATIPSQDRARA